MRTRVLLFLGLSLITCAQTMQSQENTIILEGKVLNDTINKASLNVVNLSLKIGTITDDQGQFTIRARLNDTINISAIQYESRQFVVNRTMFNRKKISLYLIPKVNELDEVNISNVTLSGRLNKDTEDTEVAPKLLPEDLGLPVNTAPPRTVEERRYYEAVSGGSGIPLNPILNAITGRLKLLRRNLEVSRFVQKVKDTRDTFSDSIYMKQLNIPEPLIEDFVYYIFEYEKADDFVDEENALGLLEFMMKKSKVYLEIRAQERQ